MGSSSVKRRRQHAASALATLMVYGVVIGGAYAVGLLVLSAVVR